MIKIGIDPSNIGTTAIVCFIKNKLVDKTEIKNKDWLVHAHKIKEYIKEQKSAIIIIENCLYTSVNASKDRDIYYDYLVLYIMIYLVLNTHSIIYILYRHVILNQLLIK